MSDTSNKDRIRQLKESYDNYYMELLKKGTKPLRSTELGLWGHFPFDVYLEFFDKIDLKRYKKFIDLGSGDGKVALLASLFTSSTGIEIDPELHEKAIDIRDSLGLNCNLIKKDYTKIDLKEYDILFINPDKDFSNFEHFIIQKIKGTLFVANNIFLPRFMRLKDTIIIDNIPFTSYSMA